MPINFDAPATLKELSDFYAKKQPHQVDQLTEETPVLSRLKFEQASHSLWNMYEEVSDVRGAGLVEMNAPLPNLGISTELHKLDLGIFGGEMEVGEDTAQVWGGKEKYFAKKMPKVLRQSGMDAEKKIIYGNLRQFAIDKKFAKDAGGTTAGCYSIIALRQVTGETCGLYSPEGFKQGAMFDTKPINGGNIYKNKDGVLVYGVRLKAYFGFQIANTRKGNQTVGAIVNIKSDKLPTPAMIDDLLADVRATPASTMLLMHQRVLTMLNTHKEKSLQVGAQDKNLDRAITHWNGIEVLTSYNFEDGTEKKVTV